MNILMVVSVCFPSTIYGGPTTVAFNQAKELIKKGHKVTIATTNIIDFNGKIVENDHQNIEGIEVRYFKASFTKPKFSSLKSKDMYKWLKEESGNYDIVHIHFAREPMLCKVANIVKKCKIPYVLQTHGMLNKKGFKNNLFDKLIVKQILLNASNILVLQDIEKKRISAISPKSNISILYNGINNRDDKDSWSLDTLHKKNILFLARLHPRKRVQDFIKMAKILNDRDIEYSFRIVGSDGGELRKAEHLIKEFNLEKKVQIVGELNNSNVVEEYLKSSVYVLPSIEEPFPMTVLEALNLGVPTIVTNSIHNRDILNSYRAVKITESNPELLANAVEELCGNEKVSSNLSCNGKKVILEELNIKVVCEKLETIYLGSAKV